MAKYCLGCGVTLQTEDVNQPGYVPSSSLDRENPVCKRCFRITHYNEVAPVEVDEEEYRKLLHRIGQEKNLVVYLLDLFDLEGSWITGLSRLTGGNPIFIVANKIDLFPQNINLNKMKNTLQYMAKEYGLKPIEIMFCSADHGTGVEKVMKAMEEFRKGNDVYIVGTTNVGKSTFINRILGKSGVGQDELLTTSRFPGTTLDRVAIPLSDESYLYDTPGVINREQMTHYVDQKELKILIPSKPVKPRIYQLDESQTLFFGGAARLDFVRGEHQSFVCYFSNLLNVHRTKLDNADALYERQLGELLSPPSKETKDHWPSLSKHVFRLPRESTDIVFSGMGWVSVKGEGAQVVVYAPQGVQVTLRPALI